MLKHVPILVACILSACNLAGCESEPCEDAVPAMSEAEITREYDAEGWDVTAAQDGGYVVAGYAASIPGPGGLGGYDAYEKSFNAYLVKTDIAGNVEWERAFGTDNADQARSVEPFSDGGYIVVGNTGSPAYSPIGVFEPTSIFVAKLDADGNVVWFRVIEGERYAVAYAVYVNDDQSFVVAGSSRPELLGADDALLLKFDADGNEQWRRRFSTGQVTVALDVIATRDVGYALSGFADGLYVVRVDEAGNPVWEFGVASTPGLTEFRSAEGLVEARDGGYIIVGQTYQDLFVGKLDEDGALVWMRRAPGAPHAFGYDVLEADNGSIVAAGTSFSYNEVGVPKCVRPYAVRFSESGSALWSGRLGSRALVLGPVSIETDGSSFVLVGTSRRSEDNLFSIYIATTDAGQQAEAAADTGSQR